MALLVKGGEIVTADERYHADIFIEDETITHIASDIPARPGVEVIDAAGKLVFPGFIDPHVHIHLPFMATFAKDTHATASVAALIGGTTTFIEMVCLFPQRRRTGRLPDLEAEGRRKLSLRLCISHGRYAIRQHNRRPITPDRR